MIVSSLNETNDGNDTITPYLPGVQPGFEAAQEFTTGSQSYVLTQILANLGGFDPGTGKDFKLTATLQADNGGTPGSVLSTFNYDISTIPTAGFAHVAFAPLSTVNLLSGVNYWFVLNGFQRRLGRRRLDLHLRYHAGRPREPAQFQQQQ